MLKSFHLLTFLGLCMDTVFVSSESVDFLTDNCDRNNGSEIRMRITYTSSPGNFVRFKRPDLTTVGTCQSGLSCIYSPGYNVTSNAHKEFDIAILQAGENDVGVWQFTSGVPTLQKNVQFTLDLTSVPVSCSSRSDLSKVIHIDQSVTEFVSCSTGPVESNLTLTLVLQQNGISFENVYNQTAIVQSGSGFSFSTSIKLDATQGLSGNYTLCYRLSTENCNYTQSKDLCYLVIYPEVTTTAGVTSEQTSLITVTTNTDSDTTIVVTTTDSGPSTDVVTPESTNTVTSISETSSTGDTVSTSTDSTSTSQSVFSQNTSPQASTPPTTPAPTTSSVTGVIVVLVIACLLTVVGIGGGIILILQWLGKANYRIILTSLAVVSVCAALGAIISTGIGLGTEDSSDYLSAGIALAVISGTVLIVVGVSAWFLYKPALSVESSRNKDTPLETVSNGRPK